MSQTSKNLKTVHLYLIPRLQVAIDNYYVDNDHDEEFNTYCFQEYVKNMIPKLMVPASIKIDYLNIDKDMNPKNLYTQLILDGLVPNYPFQDNKINLKSNDGSIETIEFNTNKN